MTEHRAPERGETRILSAEQLAEIRERAENATDAPWSQIESPWGDGKSVTQGPGDPHGHLLICRTDENEWQEELHHGEENWFNAAFIAAARTDVPALLVHSAALAERLAAAEATIEELRYIVNIVRTTGAYRDHRLSPGCDCWTCEIVRRMDAALAAAPSGGAGKEGE